MQEPDVDEGDVAKTDGRLVVRLTGQDLVVTDVSGTAPRELSRLRLPGRPTTGTELLLHDGHAVVVGTESLPVPGGPIFDRRASSRAARRGSCRSPSTATSGCGCSASTSPTPPRPP